MRDAADEALNMAAYGAFRFSSAGNTPAVNKDVIKALLGSNGPFYFPGT